MRLGKLLWLFAQFFVPAAVFAQTGTISGTITDQATGTPLPGATVIIVSTEQGASTDLDGRYTISNVEPGTYVLSARYVGYEETLEEGVVVRAGETVEIDFALIEQTVGLEEVLVVGYGTQRSEDVTGSVAVVDVENIENLPIAGPDQALTAQIPGVEVMTPTGVPGGGTQIRVRGIGAVGAGSSPLYVVDGFPLSDEDQYGAMIRNPLNDIPPGDIESITVLKDASAAAIYGSRASNGVVIINTKSGRAGAFELDVSAYAGVQAVPSREIPNLLNARDFAEFQKRVYEGRIADGLAEEVPEEYRNPEQYGEGTNWFKEVTRPAPTYNLQASLSGGSERIRSYFSVGYLSQEGIVLNTGYNRLSLRANLDASLSDRLQVGLNLAPTYSRRALAATGGTGRGGGFGQTGIASPMVSPYDEEGNLVPMIGNTGTWSFPNPILELESLDDNSTTFRALGTAFASYEILDGLTLRSSMNVDWGDYDRQFFRPSIIGNVNVDPPSIPSGTYNTETHLNWISESTLNLNRQFGPAHHFDGLAGFTIQQERVTSGVFNGSNFPDDDIRTLNAAGVITGNTGEQEWSLMSFLARVNYTLLNRYVITATVRTDGSSRFGADNRWGTFPSAALAWNIGNEPFMENVAPIQELKLRASYGVTGNNQIGNYGHLGQVVRDDYILGGSLAPGRRLATLANGLLGWETTREFNVGLDASLLNYRLNVTLDAYQRDTDNLLLELELPRTSGFGSVMENRGKIRNRGLELALNSVNVDAGTFSWSSNFNIAFNRNKTLSLGANNEPLRTGQSYEGSPTHITIVGQPVAQFYGYVIEGIYETEEDLKKYPSFPGATIGNVRYRDVNGDGVITRGDDDFAVIGSPYPDFTFGFTNTLTLGNFSLRAIIDGAMGGERILLSNASFENIDGLFNVSYDYFNNMWISPEQPGDGKTPTVRGTGNARVMFRDISNRWVSDASFVWLRNVTLRYNLPEQLLQGVSRGASIYFGIQNALLFSPYRGNPQTSMASQRGGDSAALTPGVDHFSYPLPRTFTLGIDLSF